MTSQPTPIRIPLLRISGKVEQESQAEEVPQGLERISEVEIFVLQDLPEPYFALEVPNIAKESVSLGNSLAIFGLGKDIKPLNDICALGLAGREPLVCKVIKSDARSGSSNPGEPAAPASRGKSPRKSFMTPTPLHIPESRFRQSPIRPTR